MKRNILKFLSLAVLLCGALALTIRNTQDAVYNPDYDVIVKYRFATSCQNEAQYILNGQSDDPWPIIGFDLNSLNMTSNNVVAAKFSVPVVHGGNIDAMRVIIGYDSQHVVSMDPYNCPAYDWIGVGELPLFFDADNAVWKGELDITIPVKQALDSDSKYLTLYFVAIDKEGSSLCQTFVGTKEGELIPACDLIVNGINSDSIFGPGKGSFMLDITESPAPTTATTTTLGPTVTSTIQAQTTTTSVSTTSNSPSSTQRPTAESTSAPPVKVCIGSKRRNCVPTTEPPEQVTTTEPTVCTGNKRRNCVPVDTTQPPVEVTTPDPTVCTGNKRRNCVPVEVTTPAPGQNQSGDDNAKAASNSGITAVIAASAITVAAVFAM
jgi:hypothetical protein